MKVYEPGQKLRDDLYGPGVVLEADAEYTTIRFRRFGTKKFITSMLRMEAVEEPAPPPAAKAAAAARKAAAATHPKRAARPTRAARARKKPRPRPAARPRKAKARPRRKRR